MIAESRYWKQPLLRAANWFEKIKFRADSDREFVRAEKEVFVGFYTIRKLLDTFKVRDSTRRMQFVLQWYPCIRSVDYINAHRIWDLYDLEQEGREQRDIGYLCNQFIHSYVFSIVLSEDDRIAGFHISSDKLRQTKVYFVTIEQVIEAFRVVGKDYPRESHMQRNPETLQWEGTVE